MTPVEWIVVSAVIVMCCVMLPGFYHIFIHPDRQAIYSNLTNTFPRAATSHRTNAVPAPTPVWPPADEQK